MKALSLTPGWADAIFWGEKTIEVRTWKTHHRAGGAHLREHPQALVSSEHQQLSGFISDKALCMVTLTNIEPFGPKHCDAAGFEPREMPDKPSYAWHIEHVQWVEPFDVKGQLHLFEVPDEKIRLIKPPITESEQRSVLRELFLPHVYFARGDQESRDFWTEITTG